MKPAPTAAHMARIAVLLLAALQWKPCQAEAPGTAYIFPTGARRGSRVEARVGGYYFHGDARIHLDSGSVRASPVLSEMKTLFFDGPLILRPASQGREDYPKDYRAEITVSPEAPLGTRLWHCSTLQGVTSPMKFVVGDLPETVEDEIEGPSHPVRITLPRTVNGRIFPREDTDDWEFILEKGIRVTCEIAARELGSPLHSVLELFGPDGLQIPGVTQERTRWEDPLLEFVAPLNGAYRVRVRDAAFGGGQAHVYRLTVREGGRVRAVFPLGGRAGEPVSVRIHRSDLEEPVRENLRAPNAVGLTSVSGGPVSGLPWAAAWDCSDLPEVTRWSQTDITGLQGDFAPFPGVLNGWIASPGEIHEWRVCLSPNTLVRAEVVASALGSKLDSILSVRDSAGKEVAKNDDSSDGRPDSVLQFDSGKGGDFFLRIGDRFSRRSGPDFGYRLRLLRAEPDDFELRAAADFFNALRADGEGVTQGEKPAPKNPALKVEVLGGAARKEIRLHIEGLPEGVAWEPKTIPAKAKSVDLRFIPQKGVPYGQYPVRITAVSGEGVSQVRREVLAARGSGAPGEQPSSIVRLAVTPRVPFKFAGEYRVTNDQPAGTSLSRSYRIERGGYDGPLQVMLADKQIRCLQRLSAHPVEIPAGADSFTFTVNYPTEVQLGWTSRIQLMLVGSIPDDEGLPHPVSYTSADVDDQMISVVTAGLLGIHGERNSFPAVPGVISIPVRVQRHPQLAAAPVRIGLRVPAHVRGIDASEIEIPANAQDAVLKVRCEALSGPFNVPLEITATTVPSNNTEPTHTAAMPVEFVPPAQSQNALR